MAMAMAMAPAKTLCACLLLLVFVIHVVESNRLLESEKLVEGVEEGTHVNQSAAISGIDCGALCAVRCSKASRSKICKRACGTCCSRCSCVPQGTYGNEDTCACYATMTTHGGRHKCP